MVKIAGKTTSIDYMLDHREELFIYTGNRLNDCKHLFKIVDDDLDDVIFQRVTQSSHRWKVRKKQCMDFVSISKYSVPELREIVGQAGRAYLIEASKPEPIMRVKPDGSRIPEEPARNTPENIYLQEQVESPTAKVRQFRQFRQFRQEFKVNNKGNIMNALDKVKNNNLAAAKSAATLEVGKVLNKTLVSKIRPQLPMMARGYADHAFAEVVVANIASFAVANFAPKNEKAVLATNAMMQAAMTEFVASFNIETIIADMLDGIEFPEVED